MTDYVPDENKILVAQSVSRRYGPVPGADDETVLTAILRNHQYKATRGLNAGCTCGWRGTTINSQDNFRDHLRDSILAAGFSFTTQPAPVALPADREELIAEAKEFIGKDWHSLGYPDGVMQRMVNQIRLDGTKLAERDAQLQAVEQLVTLWERVADVHGPEDTVFLSDTYRSKAAQVRDILSHAPIERTAEVPPSGINTVSDLAGRASPGDHEEYMSVRKAQRLIDERDALRAPREARTDPDDILVRFYATESDEGLSMSERRVWLTDQLSSRFEPGNDFDLLGG